MSRAVVMAGWDDVPHLSEGERTRLLAATPPHLRDARSKGIPALGAGAIYPIALEDVVVDDFEVPRHWPRGYGMDVGWNWTAAIHGAWDRDVDVIYLTREYKRGQAEPATHVAAIKRWGEKLRGVIDTSANAPSPKDGSKLRQEYEDQGLDLINADKAVEAGLFECYERFTTGRLKIFKSLQQTQAEMRLYRRDDKGKVVKENDHLMDAKRYLVMRRDEVLIWTLPQDEEPRSRGRLGARGWMRS